MLGGLPRPFFHDPDHPKGDDVHDRIAWFTKGKRARLNLKPPDRWQHESESKPEFGLVLDLRITAR